MTSSGARGQRGWAVLEVLLVYLAMVVAFRFLGRQIVEIPGSRAINQIVIFTFGSLLWLFIGRRRLSEAGIAFGTIGPSFALALRAFGIIGPACMVFLLVAVVGTTLDQWLGSTMVAMVFLAAFPLVLRVTAGLPTRGTARGTPLRVAVVVGLLALAMPLSVLAAARAPFIANVLYYGAIVGFSEEIAFRGVMQSRLNQVFDRPYEWRGVRFGAGMFISALLFGLAHTLVAAGFPIQRALFTTALGLTLGFLREKDGSVLAPSLLHAFTDLPRVFFG